MDGVGAHALTNAEADKGLLIVCASRTLFYDPFAASLSVIPLSASKHDRLAFPTEVIPCRTSPTFSPRTPLTAS